VIKDSTMSSLLPLLAFHSYQTQRLSRTPMLSPLLIVVAEGCKRVRLGEHELTACTGDWNGAHRALFSLPAAR
jgi:hypothetical protein